MNRTVAAFAILLAFLCGSAEARGHRHHYARHYYAHHHYHHVRQQQQLASCDWFHPCAFQSDFFGITKSAKVSKPSRRVVSREPNIRIERGRHRKESPVIGNGVVKAASGAIAYVAASATGAFQCVINSLENQGYPVKFMGGFARGGHIRGSLHYSGLALDINQLGRGVTRPRMPPNEIAIANSCGLISGAQWANNDSGHFQLGGYAGNGSRHYASSRHHVRYAHRHRHTRYASR